MPSISSRKIIKALRAEGWREVSQEGSHVKFKHPTRPGRVVVPHPKRDLPQATAEAIYGDAGLKPPWKR